MNLLKYIQQAAGQFVLGVCFFLCLQIAAIAQSNNSPRIIGGEDATLTHYPWMVAILEARDDSQFCGGTLIAHQWVLTAAHCVTRNSSDIVVSPSSINVLVGQANLNDTTGQIIAVKQIIVHPDYNPALLINDLALIELQTALNIPMVALLSETTPDIATGSATLVLGWGNTSTSSISNFPSQLQSLIMPVVDSALCDAQLTEADVIKSGEVINNTNSLICAAIDEGNGDSCDGDSGGPLLTADSLVQIGLVSFGAAKCGQPHTPGVYTRLSYFNAFIRNYVPDAQFTSLSGKPIVCTPQLTPLPETPNLTLTQQGLTATATWNNTAFASQYWLLYLPVGALDFSQLGSVNLGELTNLSVDYTYPAALYIAIIAENCNGMGNYSNIEVVYPVQ